MTNWSDPEILIIKQDYLVILKCFHWTRNAFIEPWTEKPFLISAHVVINSITVLHHLLMNIILFFFFRYWTTNNVLLHGRRTKISKTNTHPRVGPSFTPPGGNNEKVWGSVYINYIVLCHVITQKLLDHSGSLSSHDSTDPMGSPPRPGIQLDVSGSRHSNIIIVLPQWSCFYACGNPKS